MQLSLRPWITASIALTGAAFFVVPPAAAPLSEIQAQHRQVALKSYDEYDLSQLVSTTTTNIDALEGYFSNNPFLTSPDVAQGFSTLLTDIFTGQSNPVTNPLSVLAEGGLGVLSSGYGFNAASSAFTGVIDNVQAALSSDNYSAALTDLENGPTTVLYAALNGYPESVGSGLLSPEFGLLTSPAGDGLATGTVYAVNQIETTLANELSALGGGDVTTGSLPEVTGTVDFSVSVDQVINDVLSALGFSSGGGTLTLNDLLTDVGVNPTANLLSSVDIGEVLNLLGLSDNSGITIDQILGDLGVITAANPDPTISIDTILSDLGVITATNPDPTISIDTILSDLGVITATNPDPTFSVETILSDLGVNTSSTFTLDNILTDLGIDPSSGITVDDVLGDLGLTTGSTYSLATILGDLGIDTSKGVSIDTILSGLGIPTGDLNFSVPGISLGTILGDLGINTGTGFNEATLITDLVGNPSYTINLGIAKETISLSTFLDDLGLNKDTISLGSVLSVLGINTGSTFNPPEISIPVSTILSDLGLGNNPSVSLSTILGDLGLNGNYSIDQILGVLGINGSDSFTLNQVLGDLGLTGNYSIDQILNIAGINGSSTFDLNDVLGLLGLNGNSTIDLNDVLSALGLSGSSTIDLNDVLSALGISGTTPITIGDVLNTLGFTDSSIIPLPGFSIDNVLTDLGINPDASIDSLLTQLGIPDTLTLSPSLDLTGGPVPEYFLNLSQDLLAAVGSIQALSSDLPSLLTPDPTLALTPLLSDLVGDLGLPFSVTGGDLAANLTNVLAEVLPTLF